MHYTQYGRCTIRYDVDWLEKFRDSGGRGSHKVDVFNHLEAIEVASVAISRAFSAADIEAMAVEISKAPSTLSFIGMLT